MKEKELSEMKSLIENKCLDRRIINNGMEEFLKLSSDVKKYIIIVIIILILLKENK